MNKAQKRLVLNLIATAVIIGVFIFAFANFKDYVNKAEAVRAFNQLGQKLLDYRKQYGSLPSEPQIEEWKVQLEGNARVGTIYYRAQWISFDSPPETIVAYAEKDYEWLIESGFIVLLLDGQVQYMPVEQFKQLLAKQQTMAEAEEMRKAQRARQEF